MAHQPKISKNPLFSEAYWSRPDPRDQGDLRAEPIYQAVGVALSEWEKADQQLAHLFLVLTEATGRAFIAVRRAYGSIESNTGRRNAVLAAAEVFFGHYWNEQPIKNSLTSVVQCVGWASKRRDDIAHGVVVVHKDIFKGLAVIDPGDDRGAFLMPPEYNTGRINARFTESSDDHPLWFMRAKYRFTSEDILSMASKFTELQDVIRAYTLSIIKKDEAIPLVLTLFPVDDKGGKPY
jgi:hypothetical protein